MVFNEESNINDSDDLLTQLMKLGKQSVINNFLKGNSKPETVQIPDLDSPINEQSLPVVKDDSKVVAGRDGKIDLEEMKRDHLERSKAKAKPNIPPKHKHTTRVFPNPNCTMSRLNINLNGADISQSSKERVEYYRSMVTVNNVCIAVIILSIVVMLSLLPLIIFKLIAG